MKLTDNIDLREVIPRQTWDSDGFRAIRRMDAQIIRAAQYLVKRYGWTSIIMNDWLWGGQAEQRGLRIPGQSYYRGLGAHDVGRAIDVVPRRGRDTVADLVAQVHIDIARSPRVFWRQGIWRVETIQLARTWLHIDSIFAPGQDQTVFIDMTSRFHAFQYQDKLKEWNIC